MKNNILNAAIILGEQFEDLEKNIYLRTNEGRKLENTVKLLGNFITEATKNNDHETIFELERQALERDINCYGDAGKRISSLAGLEQAKKIFIDTLTPENAKNYLLEMNGGKELPKKIPPSDLFRNFIKNQKSEISHMIRDTSSPALKLYLGKRKEAYDHIKKEYEKNLNRGLGKEIENDRGMER